MSIVAAVTTVVVLAGALSAAGSVGTARTRTRALPETKLPAPTTTRLDDLAFFNVEDGYGLFVHQGTNKCTVRVGHTSDAAARFPALVSVASYPCEANPTVSLLAFDDHGDGFLYGPKLYVTHDGGASWTAEPQPGPVLSVEALGYSIWMLEMSHPQGPGQPGRLDVPLRLLESEDGGHTWSVVAVPRGAVEGGSGWLVRVSRTSAYLAGRPIFHKGRQLERTSMWFTSDSGSTWSGRVIPCSSASSEMDLSAAPDGTLFDECYDEPGTGMQLKSTLRSTNGGRSWQFRSRCQLTNNVKQPVVCTKDAQTEGYVSEIDAVSSSTVYLVGGRNSLDVSRDGGIRWAVVPPGLGSTAGGTSQVIFFDPSSGVVLGDGANEDPTVWSTTDGGAHWSARIPKLGSS